MPGDVTAPTIAVTATNLAGSGTATLKPGALVALDYATNATIAYSCTDPTGPNGVRPSGLSRCEATDNGQALTSGHALPTTTTGSHALQVTATDFAHNTTTQSWTYTVKAKPTPAQQTKAAQQTQRQIVKQWTPSLWDQWFTPHHTYCVVSTNCASSANPGLTVWQTGAVTTAPSGTIISAGSDNLYNKGSSEPLLQSTQHLYEALDSRGRLYAVLVPAGGTSSVPAAETSSPPAAETSPPMSRSWGSSQPVEGTSSAPEAGTSLAPVATTSSAPEEGTSSRPVAGTSLPPVAGTSPPV